MAHTDTSTTQKRPRPQRGQNRTAGQASGGKTSSRRRSGNPSSRSPRGGEADSRGAASWEREGGSRGPETYRSGRDWESEHGDGGEREPERARSEAWRGDDWRRGDQRYAGRNENMDWQHQPRESGMHDAPYRRGEPERGPSEPWRGDEARREWGGQERGRWTDDARQSMAFRRGHYDERREGWRGGQMPPHDWRDENYPGGRGYEGSRGFEGGPPSWSVGEWTERPGGGRQPSGRRDWDYERSAHPRDPREARGAGGFDYERRGWRGGEPDYRRDDGRDERGSRSGPHWSERQGPGWRSHDYGRSGEHRGDYEREERRGWGRESRSGERGW